MKPSTPKKSSRYRQGVFTPKNPHKYLGDPTKIRYMSSWELETHTFLDMNEKVLKWSSEEIAISYIKPTTGKLHKYYPDYFVEFVNKDGLIVQEIIEVKPLEQTKVPRANHKHKLYEQLMFAVNVAKWEAAQRFCAARNMKFRVITQKSIFK